MKYLSILVLSIFLNFMALPTVASIFGWELPQTNVVLNEEENHAKSVTFYEKTLPKILDIKDFLKISENDSQNHRFNIQDDAINLSPYISKFSPPPEV